MYLAFAYLWSTMVEAVYTRVCVCVCVCARVWECLIFFFSSSKQILTIYWLTWVFLIVSMKVTKKKNHAETNIVFSTKWLTADSLNWWLKNKSPNEMQMKYVVMQIKSLFRVTSVSQTQVGLLLNQLFIDSRIFIFLFVSRARANLSIS